MTTIDTSKFLELPTGCEKVVHVTERHTFRQCRRKWHYGAIQRLKPVFQGADGRSFGSAIHDALYHYYGARIPGTLINGEWPVDIALKRIVKHEDAFASEEEYALAHDLIRAYDDFAKTGDVGYKPVAVELKLVAPLEDTDMWLSGTMDLIQVDESGDLWLFDHKAYKRMVSDSELAWDDQMTMYMWLCQQNGITIKGCWYNILYKKSPTEPELLKSGKLSRAMNINTTKAKYMQTVLKHGLDPAEYADHIAKIVDTEVIFRAPVTREPAIIESKGKYAALEYKEMYRHDLPIYPEESALCTRCDYAEICVLETAQRYDDVARLLDDVAYTLKDSDDR